jgi:hypothetical protein
LDDAYFRAKQVLMLQMYDPTQNEQNSSFIFFFFSSERDDSHPEIVLCYTVIFPAATQ